MFARRTVLAGGIGLAATGRRPLQAAETDDAIIVRRALEQLHPGLLRYNSPRQMAVHFKRFDSDWRSSSDLRQRYLALTRLTAAIKCGHSYGNFYNQKKDVVESLFGARDKLPFQFRWLDNQMVVTNDPTGRMPRGSMVLTINDRRTNAILKTLLPLTRADGNNDGKRRQLLGVAGRDAFETFDCLYPLVYPETDQFRVVARTPAGTQIKPTFEAIDLKTRRAQKRLPPSKDPDAAAWSIVHAGQTAILTMDSWGLYNSKWDWKAWLDASFDELLRRNANRLVIDIRRNEGGLDCGDDIIARLIDAPLVITDVARRVRYQRVPDDLAPFLDTWDASFKDWGANATVHNDRFFDLKRGDEQTLMRPQMPRFRGQVVVLISAENSSATFQFANLMKRHRLGTLIGEPTGGNQRGINGGAFFFLRLPQSGLEIDLPLIGTFPMTQQPDAGVNPDILVTQTAGDVATDRDPVMEKALA